jgi:pyruvate dehydrogenase E1 component alpha subunit
VHYRAAPHATADDPSAYIDQARVDDARANECVARFERLLEEQGVLTQERIDATRREAEELMRAAITAAEAEPPGDPELLFSNVYVDPPENLRRG